MKTSDRFGRGRGGFAIILYLPMPIADTKMMLYFAPLEYSFVAASVVYQDKLSAALEETLPNMKPPMHSAAWLAACACFLPGVAA